MADRIKVGIIGDFDPEKRSHRATNEALGNAADDLSVDVDVSWIPTKSLLESEVRDELEQFDGLWGSPGSPYESLEGALNGIRFARERDWPFFAT